jgi:glycosyltransferase involved in cell wall biosynthesis
MAAMSTPSSSPADPLFLAQDAGVGSVSLPQRIALATHYYATGPTFDLEEYIAPRVSLLRFIAHPLQANGGPSYWRDHAGGRPAGSFSARPATAALRFAADLGRTMAWARAAAPFDLFIAGDNLLALAGLWLRRRAQARRVILYSIDFVERRFANPALNRAYHAVDRAAARRVDVVWNVSPEITEARRRRDGAGGAPAIVVPLGAHFDRIPRLAPGAPVSPTIAFLGHILEKQGLQLMIEALPQVRRAVPQASLLVLGDGPYLPRLRAQARAAGLEQAVEFAGFVPDHRLIESRLCGCALAVAPYVPDPSSFSRFADPGKVKTYLACGLPVLVTDVPAVARLVEQRGAGRLVPYDATALATAAIDLLQHQPELTKARAAAAALGAEFSWDRVFARAFQESAAYLR